VHAITTMRTESRLQAGGASVTAVLRGEM